MSKTKHTPSGTTKEAEKMWAEAEFERWFRGKFSSWNPVKPWLRGVCLDAWMMAEKLKQQEIERLRAELIESRQAARECWRLIYESGEKPISDVNCAALSQNRLWLEQD